MGAKKFQIAASLLSTTIFPKQSLQLIS